MDVARKRARQTDKEQAMDNQEKTTVTDIEEQSAQSEFDFPDAEIGDIPDVDFGAEAVPDVSLDVPDIGDVGNAPDASLDVPDVILSDPSTPDVILSEVEESPRAEQTDDNVPSPEDDPNKD